jgi:hypothetical protein
MVNGTNGLLCNSSRMRGIMVAFYRGPADSSSQV